MLAVYVGPEAALSGRRICTGRIYETRTPTFSPLLVFHFSYSALQQDQLAAGQQDPSEDYKWFPSSRIVESLTHPSVMYHIKFQ